MTNEEILYQALLMKRIARNARAELFIEYAGTLSQPMAWQKVNLDPSINLLEDNADRADAKAKVLWLRANNVPDDPYSFS
jgi:hypothetical protein